jgi:predicted AlkP superfamily phosphohydrolase/phosphomutase
MKIHWIAPVFLIIISFVSCQVADKQQDDGMVVLASLDGLGDYMFRHDDALQYLETVRNVAERGILANGMQASFPSSTTNSHAALYTGTYGNLNGITSGNLILPREEHSIFEYRSGFHSSLLRVEPVWVTAARQGKKVLAIQTTQMYPFLDHVTAADAPSPPVLVTGYGPTMLSQPKMLGLSDMELLHELPDMKLPTSALPYMKLVWVEGPFTFRAVITADDRETGYSRFWVNAGYDKEWVEVQVAAEEHSFPTGRPLARYFSPDIMLPAEDGSVRAVTNFRLFSLCPETAAFELFQPAFHEVALYDATGNEAEVLQKLYLNAGGFLGNGPSYLWRDGVFGKQLYAGGDGTAEIRYLEGVELLIRQSNRYTEWLCNYYKPDLLLDYSPYPDETDHWFYGFIRTDITGFDIGLAERYDFFRSWSMAALDQRAALLDSKAGKNGHIIFVGDHGMTAAHKTVYVNEILRAHGFLHLGSDNRLDKSSVKAYHIRSSSGIILNTTDWKNGILDPADRERVLDQLEEVLGEIRDPWTGEAVFVSFFRAGDYADGLGIGGPADMDLYYDLAPGYVHHADIGGGVFVSKMDVPIGAHSFSPVRDEMLCLFTARGPTWEKPVQVSRIRIVDIALLLCDILGIDPPPQHIGRPLDAY